MTDRAIWTIGHSNHPIETFVAMLRAAEIGVVIDVRSAPYSRWCPQYRQEPLRQSLAGQGIGYEWHGARLDGRPPAPADLFAIGIDAVLAAATAGQRIALMCSERDPDDCHRERLIAPALRDRGVTVHHIVPSGRGAP